MKNRSEIRQQRIADLMQAGLTHAEAYKLRDRREEVRAAAKVEKAAEIKAAAAAAKREVYNAEQRARYKAAREKGLSPADARKLRHQTNKIIYGTTDKGYLSTFTYVITYETVDRDGNHFLKFMHITSERQMEKKQVIQKAREILQESKNESKYQGARVLMRTIKLVMAYEKKFPPKKQ